jgi:hypothetical protein
LALQPVLEKPSLATIQALQLLSIYTALASHKGVEEDAETSMEMTWSLITLAAHLSRTIGLRKWFLYFFFWWCSWCFSFFVARRSRQRAVGLVRNDGAAAADIVLGSVRCGRMAGLYFHVVFLAQ